MTATTHLKVFVIIVIIALATGLTGCIDELDSNDDDDVEEDFDDLPETTPIHERVGHSGEEFEDETEEEEEETDVHEALQEASEDDEPELSDELERALEDANDEEHQLEDISDQIASLETEEETDHGFDEDNLLDDDVEPITDPNQDEPDNLLECTDVTVTNFNWHAQPLGEHDFTATAINRADIAGEVTVEIAFYEIEQSERLHGTITRNLPIGAGEATDFLIQGQPPSDNAEYATIGIINQECRPE